MTRDKFLSKVVKTPTGCWEWNGFINQDGYGMLSAKFNGKLTLSAHRYSYMIEKGEIPKGKQLDHLCRNRKCVNPDHLEPVTNYENMMRGNALASINAKKTHCIHGHPLSGYNLIIRNKSGHRDCRICGNERNRRHRLKLKQA